MIGAMNFTRSQTNLAHNPLQFSLHIISIFPPFTLVSFDDTFTYKISDENIGFLIFLTISLIQNLIVTGAS